MAQISKKDSLKRAVLVFRDSQKTTEDYLNLMVEVGYATRQGDGLMWSDVKEVLKLLEEKPEPVTIILTERSIMDKLGEGFVEQRMKMVKGYQGGTLKKAIIPLVEYLKKKGLQVK